MCGITGYIQQSITRDQLEGTVTRMTDAIPHRGPDDSGQWCDEITGVGLGHRRLSIIDLSPLGHQPMHSASQRYMMVYNGEVYNFPDLRKELEATGHTFRGHSDTEIMLAAMEEWGVEAATPRFNGMFAFAVWDTQDRVLHLGRDRLGVKPIYYGWYNNAFIFGSELKVITAALQTKPEINREALCLYFRYNCIPAPYSIYSGIYKLPQGALLSLNYEQLRQKPDSFSAEINTPESTSPISYWSLKDCIQKNSSAELSEEDALEELHTLLLDAIGIRMVSDVPLGAFLSGGIDSSLVVALMQAQSSQPVRSFSIGFHEAEYNEATYAAAIAKHLGTEHTELYVSPQEALDVIPDLPQIFDEPFADSSQIPTYLLAKLTRDYVTVSLSGDGGDESFAGYSRYLWADRIANTFGKIPGRNIFSRLLKILTREQWDWLIGSMHPVLPERLHFSLPGDKIYKLAKILSSPGNEDIYHQITSHWDDPGEIVLQGKEPELQKRLAQNLPNFSDNIHRMMYLDTMYYLPDDVMVKVDRATMAASLEAREPLLDYRVVEYAWGLPTEMKIRDGTGKWALKTLLRRYIPDELFERPKMGFGVPIDSWLKGPLRDWAEDLLSEKTLREDGYLNPAPIRQKWQRHLSEKDNCQYHLWDVLMFQAWLHQQD